MDYCEPNIIFVPEWFSVMTTGGLYAKEQSIRAEMENRGWVGDIRKFKVLMVQEFLQEMIMFRVDNGLLWCDVLSVNFAFLVGYIII